MKTIYIHYGHKKFNKNKFDNLKNESCFVKPLGCLWASRIDAKFGWKDWNERENFRECNIENSFLFKLKDNTKVLEIKSSKDLEKLPKVTPEWLTTFICLDFEKIAKEYDAIEVFISEDENLYWDLYGWDCDSIVVMNPDVIEMIEVIKHE